LLFIEINVLENSLDFGENSEERKRAQLLGINIQRVRRILGGEGGVSSELDV